MSEPLFVRQSYTGNNVWFVETEADQRRAMFYSEADARRYVDAVEAFDLLHEVRSYVADYCRDDATKEPLCSIDALLARVDKEK